MHTRFLELSLSSPKLSKIGPDLAGLSSLTALSLLNPLYASSHPDNILLPLLRPRPYFSSTERVEADLQKSVWPVAHALPSTVQLGRWACFRNRHDGQADTR